jgi:hypothetical protein
MASAAVSRFQFRRFYWRHYPQPIRIHGPQVMHDSNAERRIVRIPLARNIISHDTCVLIPASSRMHAMNATIDARAETSSTGTSDGMLVNVHTTAICATLVSRKNLI